MRPTTPAARTGPPASWSPPWNTPGRPSAAATPTSPTPSWWSPPAARASGSTGATSRPTAGRSKAPTDTRSWSAAKASSAAPWRCWGRLLHEAAHGLATARNIQDTSRGGRYHNRRYATLARELGLEVASVKPIGWSATSVPEATAAAYGGDLEELQAALVLWRRQEHRIGTGTRSRNLLAATCGCGRRIRAAKATLAEAPILCGACVQPFEPEDPED
jgi:hypothetical protein